MSRQQDIVPEVVRLAAGCGAPVGLILGGSVAHGKERTDSDVDFFAIADAVVQPAFAGFLLVSEKNGSKVFERKEPEFPVHVACWTTASLDEILRVKPYMLYPLLCGRIVVDPAGIAERYVTRIRHYFDAHPPLENAWHLQLAELHKSKTRDGTLLAYPQWSDFIRHLEEAFAEEIV